MRGKFLFSPRLSSTAVQTLLLRRLSYLSITRIGRVPQKLVCGDKCGVKSKIKCSNYLGQHSIRDHTSAALEWMNRWDVLQSSQQREGAKSQAASGREKYKTHWAGTSWRVSDWCYTRREFDCGASKTQCVVLFSSFVYPLLTFLSGQQRKTFCDFYFLFFIFFTTLSFNNTSAYFGETNRCLITHLPHVITA